jgi:hypothetical protein
VRGRGGIRGACRGARSWWADLVFFIVTASVGCGGRTLPSNADAYLDAQSGIGEEPNDMPAPTPDASESAVDGSDDAVASDSMVGDDVWEAEVADDVGSPDDSGDGEADAGCPTGVCGGDSGSTSPVICTAQDAVGMSGSGFSSPVCNTVLGWAWDGSQCVPIIGCSCHGSACGSLLAVRSACQEAYTSCL